MYKSCERVAERITEASGGRLVLKMHPGGGIVPAAKEFDGVDSRALDYGLSAFVYWMDKFPTAGMFTFTIGGLSPIEMYLWFATGEGNELAQRMVEGYNVVILPGQIGAPEIFLSSSKPVDSLADIKGLKIRTAGDDGVCFSEMGASVVFTPSGEIYENMQRGVIDAFQCSSPAVDWSMSLQEVADYIYLSPVRQPCEHNAYQINADAWAELPDDLKVLVKDMFMAEAWRYYGFITREDTVAVQQYKDYGCVVEPMAKDVEDEMVRQANILYEERAAEDPFYAEVLESWREYQKAIRAAYPRL